MSDEKVVVGQIEKSPTEIVRVIRQRLNGHELVSLPVFSCGRKSATGEKGLSLHLEQWRAVIPMIQRALDLELRGSETPKRRGVPSKRKPARRRQPALEITEPVTGANDAR